MKKWILLALFLGVLLALALTTGHWLPPVLEFAGANSNTIEGLVGIIQTIIWLLMAGLLIVGFMRRPKHSETKSEAPPRAGKGSIADEGIVARERYLKRFRQQCNVLPLGAMGGDEGVTEEVTLEKVYIALNTTSRVALSAEEKARPKTRSFGLGTEDRPVTALEAATQANRLVMLGDPGSGKSTFVKQLASLLASSCLGEPKAPAGWAPNTLPLLICLRDLAPALAAVPGLADMAEENRRQQLVAVLLEQWQAALVGFEAAALVPTMQQALDCGQVLMIFDGLDEVAEPLRPLVRQAITAVCQAFSTNNRVIVTCRSRSYQDATLPGFTAQVLAPFDQKQIGSFIDAWYEAQTRLGRFPPEKAKEKATDLRKAALTTHLKELASNPMLLTTMAIIHQKEVGLPRDRVKLYRLAVDILLRRWQEHKGKRHVSTELASGILQNSDKLLEIVEQLAHMAHARQAEGQEDLTLARGDLLVFLENPKYLLGPKLAGEFLDYVDQRAGILVGHGGGEKGGQPKTYSFPHRTFQEYLAGCHMITGRGIQREYLERAREGDFWYLAAQLGAEELLYNRRSEKDVLDLAYELCPVKNPSSSGDWRAVIWSGWTAALLGRTVIEQDIDKPDGGADYLKRLTPRLVTVLDSQDLKPLERAEAGRALAKLGDQRPGIGLTEEGLPDIAWLNIPVGPFVMGCEPAAAEVLDGKPKFTCNLLKEPYRISRYPVTVAIYRAFVAAGGYDQARYWTKAGWAWRIANNVSGPEEYAEVFQTANHPQVGVSWYEATAFCAWLTEVMGHEVSLPSEAQWERVARHTDGRTYPWGDASDLAERCNVWETGIRATSTVGIFQDGDASCGAADMAGNVWEWCVTKWLNDYEEYEKKVDDDPEGEEGRVLRGGSFYHFTDSVRCAARYGYNPDLRSGSFGFRVVSSPITSEF